MIKSLLVLVLIPLLWVQITAHNRTGKISRKIEAEESAKIKTVEIDNIIGSVEVTGYDGNEITIEAIKELSAELQKDLELAEKEMKLLIEREGDTLKIIVDSPCRKRTYKGNLFNIRSRNYKFSYDFRIKIPLKKDIIVSTITDGSIRVKNIVGDFDIKHCNGPIFMEGVGGAGSAKTVSGNLKINFNQNPHTHCKFETVSGEINLIFPEKPDAEFTFKSMSGEALSDFDYHHLGMDIQKKSSKNNTKFTYISNRRTKIRTGKGGISIDLSTLSGDMILSKRK